MAEAAFRGAPSPLGNRLRRKGDKLLPFGHDDIFLFAVVSICYRSESVCVFAVEPRQELNWDTNGKQDALNGLSAVAPRHRYDRPTLPRPDVLSGKIY